MKAISLRTREELQLSVNSGNKLKYLFFWGHTPKSHSLVDQSCLSNWFPAEFSVEGDQYSTAEHYMMAEKARLFGDLSIREEILQAKNPGAAKRLGRKVKDFNQEEWEKNRFKIVVAGCFAKFSQNQSLKEFLLNTEDRVLVEASPVDPIWGIGLAKDHKDIENPNTWKGLNLLGFSLMEARDQLKE